MLAHASAGQKPGKSNSNGNNTKHMVCALRAKVKP
jgi:hypothetical protein